MFVIDDISRQMDDDGGAVFTPARDFVFPGTFFQNGCNDLFGFFAGLGKF